jgi:hypothetical protein
MTSTSIEVLDVLYWKLHRILEPEHVSILQWVEPGVVKTGIVHASGFSMVAVPFSRRTSRTPVLTKIAKHANAAD